MKLTKEFKEALINVDKLPVSDLRKQIETCRLIRNELLRMNDRIDLNYTFCNNFFNWVGYDVSTGATKYEINNRIFEKESEIAADMAFYAFAEKNQNLERMLDEIFFSKRSEEAELIAEIIASGYATWFPELAYNDFIQNVIMMSRSIYNHDYIDHN